MVWKIFTQIPLLFACSKPLNCEEPVKQAKQRWNHHHHHRHHHHHHHHHILLRTCTILRSPVHLKITISPCFNHYHHYYHYRYYYYYYYYYSYSLILTYTIYDHRSI